ncbi:MAG: glycoside hydrolase family 99-like domain-containing protein, partial [Promethearchaeota archaeon]
LSEKDSAINQLNDFLSEKDNTINQLKDFFSEKDSTINQLKDFLSEKDSTINQLKDSLSEKDGAINQLQNFLSEKDSTINQLKDSLSEKDSEINQLKDSLSEKDSEINQLNDFLSEKDSEINQLNDFLSEKDSEINQLNDFLSEKDSEINQIKDSLSEKGIPINQLKDSIPEKGSPINQLKLQKITNLISEKNIGYLHEKSKIFHLREKIQRIKERILPLGTIRRESYDKFWYILNEKFQKFKNLLPLLGIERQESYDKLWYAPKSKGLVKENYLREDYFKMILEQKRKKSNEYFEYKEYNLGETRIKLIAFYLPQFHPIPENDRFWGKGFTEWINVTKTVPQFMGHYQPHLPGELGFYDLRLVENIKKQVKLAKNYGIYAFCFHHYWFNGRGVMRTPIDLFVKHKEIDFKFCINWANENWTRKWDGLNQDILLQQKYTSEDDITFIEDTAKYFSDPRYIRINGKPLLIIYRPALFPNPKATTERWRKWCRNNGIGEIYLVSTHSFDNINPKVMGFDATIEYPPNNFPLKNITHSINLVNSSFEGIVLSYDNLIKLSKNYINPGYKKFRGICPSWDNEPRKPGRGTILYGSSPNKYRNWLTYLLDYTYKNFKKEERLIFINAWNEWAEGAYLEPDRKYGYAFLDMTARSLKNVEKKFKEKKIVVVAHDAHPHGAQFLILNVVKTLKEQFGFNIITILKDDGKLKTEFTKYSKVIEWFNLNKQEKFLITKTIHDRDYVKAICNTSDVGEVVEYLKKTGFKIITLIHEMEGIIKEKNLKDSIDKILKYSDLLVFPGKQVLESFPNITKPIRQKTIFRPQGIYLKNTYKNDIKEAREEIRKRYKLPKNSIIVLNIGYADYRKGFDLFIEIGKKILDQNKNIYFIWVSHYEKEIFKRTTAKIEKKKRKNFIFPGFVEDVGIFYAASDIFLLTSRQDPFPSVVLEALDVGLPVIGFEGAGSFCELFKEKGGILIPYLDIAIATKEVIELINNKSKRERISQEAKEIAQDRFDFNDYVYDLLNYLNIYVPRISVIIPNYNYEKYIEIRLNSIINQSYKPYEIIFLDDCSKDNSVNIASDHLSKSNFKHKIFKNTRNQGCFKQWLKGIREAKGDIIWIAESDDICDNVFLQNLIEFFEDEKVTVVYCQSKVIDENSNILNYDYKEWTNDLSKTKWKSTYCNEGKNEVAEVLCVKNTIPNASATLIRKSALLGIDKYLQKFKTSGDWFTYIYALKNGKICFSSKKLNYHRRHKKSIIATTAASFGHFNDHLEIIMYVVDNFRLTENQLAKSLEFLDKEYIKLLSKRTGYKTISEDPRFSKKIKRIPKKLTEIKKKIKYIEPKSVVIPEFDFILEGTSNPPELIQKKVSIIIPTKNAGIDFEFTLEKIRSQKGLSKIEIIIVDSGSTDETVKCAKKYNTKIFSINPEEFNHGLTRNFGAEKATGDYILFTVQDAIPVGSYWLYNMVKVLESNSKIAALSCRQVPKSNADLFACFQVWMHYKSLWSHEDKIVGLVNNFEELSSFEKRKLCCLDDVCNLIRKDVFNDFKFKEMHFAEDLDLGLRLIKAGYKLAFLSSIAVIHSHNRDAFYFLKRYYADIKILQKLLNMEKIWVDGNFDELLSSFLAMYSAINSSIINVKEFLNNTTSDNKYFDAITLLENLIPKNFQAKHIKFAENQLLNTFLQKCDAIRKKKKTTENCKNYLISSYLHQLNTIKEFVSLNRPTIDNLITILYNIYSIVVSAVLANMLPKYDDERKFVIKNLLEGGI